MTGDFFEISSGTPINKKIVCFTGHYQHFRFIQGIKYYALSHWKFRIKHTTHLQGGTFLRNKHKKKRTDHKYFC